MAIPPDGVVPQVETELMAHDKWDAFDDETVKGIRVYGVGTGIKVVML